MRQNIFIEIFSIIIWFVSGYFFFYKLHHLVSKRWRYCLVAAIALWGACGQSASAQTKGAFYIDLQDFPLYVKSGFDITDVSRPPDPDSGEWISIAPWRRTVTVKDLGISDEPRRPFLAPWGTDVREYTFVIPFNVNSSMLSLLDLKDTRPGVSFASVGDNWEVYFNGRLVRQEMHLDGKGNIRSHRSMRQVFFPLDKTLFSAGMNILALRIVGDPVAPLTGFYYSSPYYIDEYPVILKRNSNTVVAALIGVYIFMGIYHLFMFMLRRKDTWNLYYALFSILLGLHSFCRIQEVYRFIPDTSVTFRIEYLAVFLILPTGAAFLEKFFLEKVSLGTKVFAAFFGLLALTQILFSPAFREDVLLVWLIFALVEGLIIVVYDLGRLFILAVEEYRWQCAVKGKACSLLGAIFRSLGTTAVGNILIGAVISAVTGMFDVIDSLVLHKGLAFTRYGFFIFTAGTALVLARRTALFYEDRLKVQTLQSQLESQIRQSRLIEGAQKQAGEIRHEMKNLLFALQIELKQKNYEGIETRLNTLLGEMQQYELKPYTAIPVIDAMIGYKGEKLREQGDDFSVSVDPLYVSDDLAYDLASLLAITLDNATEAVKDMKGAAVRLDISRRKNLVFIMVSNPLTKPLKYRDGELQSTKEEPGHGLGLPALRRIVERYSGEVRINDQNGVFLLKVMLMRTGE